MAIAFLVAVPVLVNAESQFITTTTTPVTASAHLDFRIEIPKVLFLRVGGGADYTTNPNINLITFNVNAANIGDGSVVAGTAASGDLGNGAVTAKVVGNNGTITFTSTTLGALQNGTGDTISHSQIVATVGTLTTAVALAHPALADADTTSVSLIPASGRLINRDASWTFTYLNQNVVAPGTYGGVNTNNSRVTYTASMP
ncbi:MAG: hypothetical protein ACREPB_13230 [Arenimonas sp.]